MIIYYNSYRLSFSAPPVISKEGSSEFELGNQEVGLLTCIIAISQPPAKVTWYKDGRPLEHIPGRINFLDHGHTVVSSNGMLEMIFYKLKLLFFFQL